MNFNQWKNYASKKSVSKVTYLCGDQPALVELVVDDIRNILEVPITDFIELDAKQDKSIWEAASQYPLDPNANRLVVVRNSESVTSWNQLPSWLAESRRNPKNYLLFVSNLSDGPAIFAKNKKVGYTDYIELIRTKGKFIKCSQPNDEDLIKWAQEYGLNTSGAQHIVERTSGDTSLMLDVFIKLHVWDGSPSIKALNLLCQEQALDSFADYLILRDKKSAMLSLQTMPEDEKSKIISRLDYRLDTMMEIARHVRRRMYAGDIAATTGIKIYLVKRFTPISKDYDDKKIRYCRQLLAVTDGALKDGARTGVWETLVTLW